jgi:hypothetical protein
VIQKWSQFALYRDRASFLSNLYPDRKNCAMLRSLRLLWNYHHSQDGVTASIRLSTTNALYCRAVIVHARRNKKENQKLRRNPKDSDCEIT